MCRLPVLSYPQATTRRRFASADPYAPAVSASSILVSQTQMSPPRLLVLERLLQPSGQAQRTLNGIEDKLPNTPSGSIELKGLFVFLVSALETMLSDTYVYFLQAFPEAFDFKDIRFGKDEIVGSTLAIDLIERQIERNAIALAYSSLPELLNTFIKALGIAEPSLDEDIVDRLVEVKETRNMLLHNSLIASRQYVVRAGRFRRTKSEGAELPLTKEYIGSACKNVGDLIGELRKRMDEKYKTYTRIAAFRRLWDYLFSSPIMQFDDYWTIDSEKDEFSSLKVSPWEESLSSSEQAFLAIWRMHFNGWNKPQNIASMYGLDTENQKKMLWFLAILRDFNLR